MRIASLLPSATEIVCALGAEAELVGVSHECDYPPSVRGLPALTRPKVRIDGTSAAIDRTVRDLVERGLSVYAIDVDRLATLAPDVIVTQQQCEVCAVSYDDVKEAAERVLGPGAVIVSLSSNTLEDVWRDVAAVAAALGRQAEGVALVASLRRRLDALRERTREGTRPSIACVEWLDPLMAAGNWVPELVEIAGGSYPFGGPGDATGTIEWDRLREADPDVVVLMPCGFTIEQTRRELPMLTTRPEWRGLRAVREGRAAVVDGNAYFNRPGPRLVESALILAAVAHPELGVAGVPAGAVEPVGV